MVRFTNSPFLVEPLKDGAEPFYTLEGQLFKAVECGECEKSQKAIFAVAAGSLLVNNFFRIIFAGPGYCLLIS